MFTAHLQRGCPALQVGPSECWTGAAPALDADLMFEEAECLCNPGAHAARAHQVPIRQLARIYMRMQEPILYPHIPQESELVTLFSKKLDRQTRFQLEKAITSSKVIHGAPAVGSLSQFAADARRDLEAGTQPGSQQKNKKRRLDEGQASGRTSTRAKSKHDPSAVAHGQTDSADGRRNAAIAKRGHIHLSLQQQRTQPATSDARNREVGANPAKITHDTDPASTEPAAGIALSAPDPFDSARRSTGSIGSTRARPGIPDHPPGQDLLAPFWSGTTAVRD